MGFEKMCDSCGECKWAGIDEQYKWSFGGGGHSLSDCIGACNNNENCGFASLSKLGWCHMTKYCNQTQGPNDWVRYEKKFNQGSFRVYFDIIQTFIIIWLHKD